MGNKQNDVSPMFVDIDIPEKNKCSYGMCMFVSILYN